MAYKKYFTLSYDDGSYADRKLVPMINEYGLKCTFNLNSGRMSADDRNDWRICTDEINTLYKGHEIATHGLEHPHYREMKPEEIIYDITEDMKNLSAIVGHPVLGHAYPYGCFNQYVIDVAATTGIRYARVATSDETVDPPKNWLEWYPTCHHANPKIFTLLEDFINAEPTDHDLLFYLWGHSFELEEENKEFNNWDHIEKVFRMISGRSDITYVTNMEFFESHQ